MPTLWHQSGAKEVRASCQNLATTGAPSADRDFQPAKSQEIDATVVPLSQQICPVCEAREIEKGNGRVTRLRSSFVLCFFPGAKNCIHLALGSWFTAIEDQQSLGFYKWVITIACKKLPEAFLGDDDLHSTGVPLAGIYGTNPIRS